MALLEKIGQTPGKTALLLILPRSQARASDCVGGGSAAAVRTEGTLPFPLVKRRPMQNVSNHRDYADVKCSHCARGCGRFCGCVIIRTPENEALACTNCHWNNHGERCSLSTIGRAPEKTSQDPGGDREAGVKKEDDEEIIDFVTGWLPILKQKLAKARTGRSKASQGTWIREEDQGRRIYSGQ